MNLQLTPNTVLIVAVAVVFASAIGYANFASAVNSKEGVSPTSVPNKEYLLNCILDDTTDGVIQQFEPLGCSSINGNIQGASGTETNDGSENADISVMDHNIGENNNYLYEVNGYYFEDPYEVGWD
jgi:hypothetical protein